MKDYEIVLNCMQSTKLKLSLKQISFQTSLKPQKILSIINSKLIPDGYPVKIETNQYGNKVAYLPRKYLHKSALKKYSDCANCGCSEFFTYKKNYVVRCGGCDMNFVPVRKSSGAFKNV